MNLARRNPVGFQVLAVGLLAAMTAGLAVHPHLAGLALGAVAVVAGAAVSPAIPAAATSLPDTIAGALGTNPFPHKSAPILLALWMLAAVANTVRRRRIEIELLFSPPLLLALIFGAVLALHSTATPALAGVATNRWGLYLCQNVPLLVAGMAIGRRRRDTELYVWCAVAATIALGVVIILNLARGQAVAVVGGRVSIDEQVHPIEVGRLMAGAILMTIWLAAKQRSLSFVTACGVGVILIVPLLAAGSRGPIVGLVVGIIALVLATGRRKALLRRLPGVVALAVPLFLVLARFAPSADMHRAISILTGAAGGLDSNHRTDLWSAALSEFWAHPFVGGGTASFAVLQPVYVYPHNLLLEAAAENGIVGLALIIGLLVGAVVGLRRAFRTERGMLSASDHPPLVTGLFVAAFTNAMFSGDVAANAALWLACGLAVGLGWRTPRAQKALPAR